MSQKPKRKKAGRPPLPKGQAKSRILPVRFTEEAIRAMESAAKAKGQTLSEWIRAALLEAIQQ